MLDLLWDWFSWPSMKGDVKEHLQNCECLWFKAIPMRAELQPIKAPYQLGLVHMDYLNIEAGMSDKDVTILVSTDHFTRYPKATVINLQTAKAMAKALCNKFIIHYRWLGCIISMSREKFLK